MRIISLKHSSVASSWFDFLRWFAAFYVVVFHLRPILFVGSSQLPRADLLARLLYAATSVGYQFVMLFFVLSGFLIGSSVLTQIFDGAWDWRTYLIHRFTRLWIVLIPALGLTWVWALVEAAIFHNSTYFKPSANLETLLGNAFFSQGIIVSNFGQNLPLWSLSYEFWYYILFPCAILAFVAKQLYMRYVYAIICALIVLFVGKDITLYFLVWLMGAALAVLPSPQIRRKHLASICLPCSSVLLLVALAYGKHYIGSHHVGNFDMIQAFPADFLVSVMFLAILYFILHAYNNNSLLHTSRFKRLSAELASFSYTLYLTHYPVINFLREWLGNGTWGTWQPNFLHCIYGFLAITGILTYAFSVSRVTERRTSQVREVILRLLNSMGIQTNREPMTHR